MLDQEFLKILVCPQTRQPLRVADAALLARLNEAVAAGRIANAAGRPVQEALEGAMIRNDGAVVYPIIDGIPVLLAEEAIPLESLGLP